MRDSYGTRSATGVATAGRRVPRPRNRMRRTTGRPPPELEWTTRGSARVPWVRRQEDGVRGVPHGRTSFDFGRRHVRLAAEAWCGLDARLALATWRSLGPTRGLSVIDERSKPGRRVGGSEAEVCLCRLGVAQVAPDDLAPVGQWLALPHDDDRPGPRTRATERWDSSKCRGARDCGCSRSAFVQLPGAYCTPTAARGRELAATFGAVEALDSVSRGLGQVPLLPSRVRRREASTDTPRRVWKDLRRRKPGRTLRR